MLSQLYWVSIEIIASLAPSGAEVGAGYSRPTVNAYFSGYEAFSDLKHVKSFTKVGTFLAFILNVSILSYYF